MRKNNQRRVAIVHPYTNLDSVPSVYNTAVLLARHGYLVDVFTRFDDRHHPPEFDDDRIAVLSIEPPPRSEWPWLWRALPGRFYYRWHWPTRSLLRHRQAPYTCVIGVDPPGLVTAQALAATVKAPLAYYSLELLLSYEVSTEEERELKAKELALSRQACLVIIQDEERAGLLIRDNNLAPERVVCVPNAPLGKAHVRRSDYLRRKFGISSKTRIVLHSGSLGAWAGTHQLMLATREWPDDWLLICHTRYRPMGFMPDYLEALRCLAKPGSVLFSTEPVPAQEYAELVASADVGIVYYCPIPGSSVYTQDNIRYIGLSSGKLAAYLQAGVPVVVNTIPSLQRLVDAYGCGVVVENPAHNREAIERILADYPTYCANAVRCFDQEMDFEGKFQQVLKALECLKPSNS